MSTLMVGFSDDTMPITRRATELGLDFTNVKIALDASIAVAAVNEWIGIEPPEGVEWLSLHSPIPEADDVRGTWLYMSEQTACNVSQLVLFKFEPTTS
jgi:hypothetical protein